MARVAAGACAAIVAAGTLLLLATYLLHKERPVAGTPGPRALFHATLFKLPAGQSACISPVTLAPSGRTVVLQLGEEAGANGSPPLDVLLTAPGYRARARLAAGQSEGEAQVPIHPPRQFAIGSACIINRGSTPALLAGSTEHRSRSRVKLTIGGKPVAGDVALTLLGNHGKSRLSRIGDVFEHASNLTDRLVPVWLIWIIVVLTLLLVPLATVSSLHRALREDEL